jgi:uncharacterized lipoprotein YbaY
MAQAIQKELGRDELIQHLANPFAFVFSYNKAALKDRLSYHVFSTETIEYLQGLEKTYLTK